MSSHQVIEANLRGETEQFVKALQSTQNPLNSTPFFDGAREIIVTRAPGRLDVMGGIADYSGALVLQLPIKNATHVALQKLPSKALRVLSLGSGAEDRFVELDLRDFENQGETISFLNAQRRFSGPNDHWLSYVAGAFVVLMAEKKVRFTQGASILIASTVPEGKGVSSSAAVEVSVMQAVNVAFGLDLQLADLAQLCQKVENFIAGAPSGIMDQMTSACGKENQLLELLCQPDIVKGNVRLPEELELWGLDSGVRHSVSGADYGTVRTAAFMGYRMIADIAGLEVSKSDEVGKLQIGDSKWKGYLANITPQEFELNFATSLPESMNGAEFLERYEGINDDATNVNPDADYPIHNATRHPIYEHARVRLFATTLRNWTGLEQAPKLGELMFESHQSYSDCGLGSDATDLLASLVRESIGEGLFGARITGGGSGGTVAVLGRAGSSEAIERVTKRFYEQTGHHPFIFSGSSPGAGVFDHLRIENL